ncbi:MAG TPA: hypothetical protein PLI88_02825 [Bacillota bacterium]|nr:hypothetical protein [Bacillota bacterium]HOH10450.1 hypothetical protein [Bacillota bacterium]HOY89151.1 hypothetical protein [Bacillota bacterium]HPI01066.1 hypothetical protein [Bacillota bacterium]HPM63163.1 hypothetical protein [Bacillota bacterium]
MRRRLVTLVVLSIMLFAAINACGATKYFYLGQDLNTDITLTKGELAALQLTAYYNNTGALTGKLVRQSLRAMLGSMSLDVFVDTVVQEGWPVYKSGTQFTVSDAELMLAYIEAGDVVLGWVNKYFPNISPSAVNIVFTVKGFQIGTYKQGKFTLQR